MKFKYTDNNILGQEKKLSHSLINVLLKYSEGIDHDSKTYTHLQTKNLSISNMDTARAIFDGFYEQCEYRDLNKLEIMSFSTIVQLVLENTPFSELNSQLNRYQKIGLATNLNEMGLEEIDLEELMRVAEFASVRCDNTCDANPNTLLSAILTAHSFGSY